LGGRRVVLLLRQRRKCAAGWRVNHARTEKALRCGVKREKAASTGSMQ